MKRIAFIVLFAALSCGPVYEKERRCVADSSAVRRDPVHMVSDQLVRNQVFDPDCIDYFSEAVRELGFFGALFSTADRMTRSSRIGSALSRPDADGKVHEGPEAYRIKRKGK